MFPDVLTSYTSGQSASKHSHFSETLRSYSEHSGVVPPLILTSSYLDYATLVKGKLRGFPSPGMWLSIDPRSNSDLLLPFDGSRERNWLSNSKSKMGKDTCLSNVTDVHRQKHFPHCFAGPLLHLRPQTNI